MRFFCLFRRPVAVRRLGCFYGRVLCLQGDFVDWGRSFLMGGRFAGESVRCKLFIVTSHWGGGHLKRPLDEAGQQLGEDTLESRKHDA